MKAVDRGNRAISTVLHATCIVFTPAMFQLACTGAFIWHFCGPLYAGSLLLSSGLYTAFSVKFTQVNQSSFAGIFTTFASTEHPIESP